MREPKFRNEIINIRIREFCANRGITCKKFAEMINADEYEDTNITAESVRQWVEGYSRPELSKIPLIARTTGYSCDELLGHEGTSALSRTAILEFEIVGLKNDMKDLIQRIDEILNDGSDMRDKERL